MSLDENKQPDLTEETEASSAAPIEEVAEAEPVAEADAQDMPAMDEDDRFSAFDQPVVREKTAKGKKMNKRTRTLLLTTSVAVVLALAVLAVTLFPFPTENEGSTSSSDNTTEETESYTLLDKTVDDEETVAVKRVDVTNADDTYTVLYNATDKLYQLKGYEDLVLETDGTDSLTSCISLIIANGKVENVENLADFGLDQPTATVTGTYHDDSTATLYVGDEIPSGDGYYVKMKDSEEVYICSADSVDTFLLTGSLFVETTLLTAPEVESDDANGSPTLREITLSGKSHPTPLTIRRKVDADDDTLSFYTYIITQPYKRGAADTVANLLSTFYSLTANQAVILHPSAKEKTALGFDDPLTVMNITLCVVTTSSEDTSSATDSTETTEEVTRFYNTSKSTITIGSKDEDGNYLVMMDGINAIFLVDASSLNTVAERTYDNTVADLLFLKDITEVGTIEITVDGVKHDLTLTHYPDEEDRDNSLVVTEGDSTYSTPDFRTLYQLMMSLSRYQPLDKKPTGEPALGIAIIDRSGEVFLSADFYAAGGSLYHVLTSEGEMFTTKASGITHFIKQVNNLFNGETVLLETY